jgi:hypothetical protein
MPGFNGTGPAGLGPMTGWGRGYCNPYIASYGQAPVTGPTYWAPGYWRGFGRGLGFGRGRALGRGFRRGYGPGFGWGLGYGRGFGWRRAYPAWGGW